MKRHKKPRSVRPKTKVGVCLWEFDGKYLSNGEDSFLSMEGIIGDPVVEDKMRKAAHYWTGISLGKPVWLPGYRKVTDAEYDDQMARFLDGQIPDPIDEARQIIEGG